MATEEADEALVDYRMPSLVKRERSHVWREFLFGSADFWYFFVPLCLYFKSPSGKHHLRFRRNSEFAPILFNVLFGFQHACVAVTSITAPALWLRGFYEDDFHYYALQSGVILAGICTILNSLELKSLNFPFQFGTGLLSVVYNSVVFIPVYFDRMNQLTLIDSETVHDAFGKLLGTTAVCGAAYVALAFIPRRIMRRVIPPFISGVVLVHVGLNRMIKCAQLWGGGVFCAQMFGFGDPELELCRDSGDVQLPFGSRYYLGLGLAVLVLYLLCEVFGSPFVRHNIITCSVVPVAILTSFLTKNGANFNSGENTDDAPFIGFLWTTTYQLGFDRRAVLPLLGAYLVTYLETTVILEGTLEESGVKAGSPEAERRVSGGLKAGAILSCLAPLATGFPLVPSASNSTVISLTKQASSSIGIAAGLWLLIFGIFGKLLGVFMDVPASLKGAMGVILVSGVIWTGIKVLLYEKWTRRVAIIVVLSLATGVAGIVEPNFFNDGLWPVEEDEELSSFKYSLRLAVLTMAQVPYFVSGFTAVALHLILPRNMEITEDDDDALLENYEPVCQQHEGPEEYQIAD